MIPPAATASGRRITYYNGTVPAEVITIDPPGSETINGATTYLLSTQTEFVEILDAMSGGWIVVGND